jgi:hypothetical protein
LPGELVLANSLDREPAGTLYQPHILIFAPDDVNSDSSTKASFHMTARPPSDETANHLSDFDVLPYPLRIP